MNLKCLYCQTPFTLSMNEKIGALRLMHTDNMHHYDAYCPRCRRANSVSRERLEMFTPGWQQAISAAPEQTTAPPAPAPVAPKTESAPAPTASRAKHPTAAKKATPAAKKPAAKPAASKAKPASKAPAKKPKAAAKKSK